MSTGPAPRRDNAFTLLRRLVSGGVSLAKLEVEPAEALFVGDRRYEDMRGAKELGMTTVQAFWFRADDDERGLDPDYEAFTAMDVLNVARRLTGEL